MNDIELPYVGRSLLRREDRRLLTGQGQFIADLVLPRMLHAVVVRSQVAHARIRSVDLTRSRAMPGVVDALNGADLLQLLPPVPEGQISMPSKWATVIQHKFLNPQEPLLAHDKVRHVGEAIAIIVAETRNQAEDAAEQVGIDLEELLGQAAQFLFQPLAVPVGDHDGRAGVSEDRGERVAEAGRSPGDQGHLVADVKQVVNDAHQAARRLLKMRSRFTFGIVMATTSAAP